MEDHYPISQKASERYLYGVSNGAAFVIESALTIEKYFNTVLPFSTAGYIGPTYDSLIFDLEEYPSFHIAVGRQEESIYNANVGFVQNLVNNNIDVEFIIKETGHDGNMWLEEFITFFLSEMKVDSLSN